jgi:SAM-dependent methyltransferase
VSVLARLAVQEEQAGGLSERVRTLLAPFSGDELVLDAGCGTGAFAIAVAPEVREVVGVDPRSDYLEAARGLAPANARFEEGDAEALPFSYATFDLAACLRVLHHVRRPELGVSELARVTRPGGRILVADQLGSVDPLRRLEMDRFERSRDASHTRLLSDQDVRSLLDANDLVLISSEIATETRDLERYLDLAEVPEAERPAIRGLAPAPAYAVEVGWYVARKPGP